MIQLVCLGRDARWNSTRLRCKMVTLTQPTSSSHDFRMQKQRGGFLILFQTKGTFLPAALHECGWLRPLFLLSRWTPGFVRSMRMATAVRLRVLPWRRLPSPRLLCAVCPGRRCFWDQVDQQLKRPQNLLRSSSEGSFRTSELRFKQLFRDEGAAGGIAR